MIMSMRAYIAVIDWNVFAAILVRKKARYTNGMNNNITI